jgi:3-hydroxybutyryl-CoA dehydrogenase
MASERKVAVIGAGTMGAGIAELCAARGCAVALIDVQRAVLERAHTGIRERLARRVQKANISEAEATATLGRVSLHERGESAAADVDLLIEAVPEDMALKARVLSAILPHLSATSLVATNTSSLSVTELGKRVGVAERLVGLHFFNPPPVMPLVEIVRGLSTSEATLQRARDFVTALGKELIVVNDAPGFATSRLGVLLGAEAIRMLESGVASVQDIDRAMELGYRHPMGPLKLTDLVGLDVRLAILEHLHREIGEQFRPPVLLRQLVRAGKLGKKTGAGFYLWNEDGALPNPELVR